MQLRYTNRLLTETSPYLQLHAHDPVDWFPWGPEAFARARREDKPIFLSVGYSTCHWCHVMQDESFSNAGIADYMNRHFISVKVDREEYPDVDRLYMGYATSVSDGGWPMSLFLTPDLKPFAGANYLPPDDRGNEPGFGTVLTRVHTLWDTNRPAALKAAENGTTTIELHARGAGAGPRVAPGIFDDTFRGITASYDPDGGGFSGAPKFPRPVVMTFLLRYYARTGDAPALDMTLDTLRGMARGGMYDQLGGGFHRYATDRLWRIPHFEKMLYDQAQLALAYAEAYQVTKDPDFAEVARGILDYVLRDMRDPGGAFYSAEDADSASGPGARPSEGAFYVWTAGDVRRVLRQGDADVFAYHYGVEEGGNVPAALDAQGELRGQNVLSVRHSTAETAARFRRTESDVLRSLNASKEMLRSVRAARPRPPRDDKILVAWNGLMISALARTSQIVDDSRYLSAARAAAAFIEARLYVPPTGSLTRRYRQGRADIDALLEDYAFLVQGLLDLHEASFETRWLSWAIRLQETQDRLFWDASGGGYYSTRADAPHLLARVKEDYDGAEPAANSVATMNLLRLWQITGAQTWLDHADGTVSGLSERLARSGAAMPQLVAALDFRRSTPKQIVIAGAPGAADTRALLRLVHDRFIPNKILMLADGGTEQTQMASLAPYVRDMAPRDGRATIYVCEHYVCRLPTSDPAAAARLLDAR